MPLLSYTFYQQVHEFYLLSFFICPEQANFSEGAGFQLTDTYKFLQPSYMFTDKEHRGLFEFSDEIGNLSIGAETANDVVPSNRVEANDKDLLLSTSEKEESTGASNNGSAYSAPVYDSSSVSAAASQAQSEPLISNVAVASQQASFAIDDLLGLGLPAEPTPVSAPPPLKLNSRAVLDPATFQQKWRQLPISVSQVHLCACLK